MSNANFRGVLIRCALLALAGVLLVALATVMWWTSSSPAPQATGSPHSSAGATHAPASTETSLGGADLPTFPSRELVDGERLRVIGAGSAPVSGALAIFDAASCIDQDASKSVPSNVHGEVDVPAGASSVTVLAPGYVAASTLLTRLPIRDGTRMLNMGPSCRVHITAVDLFRNPVPDGTCLVLDASGEPRREGYSGRWLRFQENVRGITPVAFAATSRDGAVVFDMVPAGRYSVVAWEDHIVVTGRPIELEGGQSVAIKVSLAPLMIAAIRFAPDIPPGVRMQIAADQPLAYAGGDALVAHWESTILRKHPEATVLVALSRSMAPQDVVDCSLAFPPDTQSATCKLVPVKLWASVEEIEYHYRVPPGMQSVDIIVHDQSGTEVKGVSGMVTSRTRDGGRASRWYFVAGRPLMLAPGEYSLGLEGVGATVQNWRFGVNAGGSNRVDLTLPFNIVSVSVRVRHKDGRVPQGVSLSCTSDSCSFSTTSGAPGDVPLMLPAGRVRIAARVGFGAESSASFEVSKRADGPVLLSLTVD